MRLNNNKTLSYISGFDKFINFICHPVFIIIFDIIYVSILIIIPFVLALFNVWYFSKISASQMLTYVGSMSTPFLIINLTLITFLSNERRKKKTIIYLDTQDEFILGGDCISIPIKVKTENSNGYIDYEALEVKIDDRKSEQLFIKGQDNMEVKYVKNREARRIAIYILSERFEKLDIKNSVSVRLCIKVINDGVVTINKFSFSATNESDDSYFKITKEFPYI